MKSLERRTVEEAAENYANLYYDKNSELTSVISESIEWKNRNHNFIAGTKWQAEQDKNKWSNEEVLELLLKSKIETSNLYYEDMKEWFEQFKKK